jgi:putative flippase GtrA
MIRPRFKRNERIHEIALRSDWTFSARLAAAGLVIGVLVLPLLLGGNPEMQALASTIRFLGWVFAISFACIAVIRYVVQRREARDPGDADDGMQ